MSYGEYAYGATPYKYEDPIKPSIVNYTNVNGIEEIEDPNNGVDLMFGLDDNDLTIKEGDIVITSGTYLIKQRLKDMFQSILGDYIYDLSNGLPWIDIIQKKYSLTEINAMIRSAALSQPLISGVLSLSSSFVRDTGMLYVRIKLQTIYGEIKLTLAK